MRTLKYLAAYVMGSVVMMQAVQAADIKTVGVWDDRKTPLMSCYLHLEVEQGKYRAVTRNCERGSERFEGDQTALRQVGKDRFRPSDSRLGAWFYLISSSGDLEVRDDKGVIRTIPSNLPKSFAQRRAKLKGEGVSIGMQKDQVLASSWGKPQKINRTQSAVGIREQWVYPNGYLYFDGDTLVVIQN